VNSCFFTAGTGLKKVPESRLAERSILLSSEGQRTEVSETSIITEGTLTF